MNTSRSRLNSGCWARQAPRAAATSGRSCSAAWAVFFSRQPASLEETADRRRADRDAVGRQPGLQLGDGDVGRRRQQRVDQVGMVGKLGRPAAGGWSGLEAGSAPALHQLDHAARADLKLGRGGAPRGAGFDRAHHPFAQIQRIRSRHPSLASSIQQPV
jgi:hypothetical protein